MTTPTTIDSRGVLTARNAAEYLDSSVQMLAKWRHLKIGPPYLKIGGKVLYRVKSLDKYLDDLEDQQMSRQS